MICIGRSGGKRKAPIRHSFEFGKASSTGTSTSAKKQIVSANTLMKRELGVPAVTLRSFSASNLNVILKKCSPTPEAQLSILNKKTGIADNA